MERFLAPCWRNALSIASTCKGIELRGLGRVWEE